MENIIELTDQELNQINGGSWLAVALMFVAPGAGCLLLGFEHGYAEAAGN